MTPTILALTSFLVGYTAAWLNHGQVFKRIKTTRHYMKRGHSFKHAWKYAGVTL